jgi:hypothetical protein
MSASLRLPIGIGCIAAIGLLACSGTTNTGPGNGTGQLSSGGSQPFGGMNMGAGGAAIPGGGGAVVGPQGNGGTVPNTGTGGYLPGTGNQPGGGMPGGGGGGRGGGGGWRKRRLLRRRSARELQPERRNLGTPDL